MERGYCEAQVWQGEVCRVTMGHLRVTIGHLRVTVGHPRVTIGHYMITIGYRSFHFFIVYANIRHQQHNTNTTELHPKVRQTCYNLLSKYSDVVIIIVTLVSFSYNLLQLNKVCCQLTIACTCATK